MWWSSGSGTSRLIGSIRYQAGVQRSVIWFKELVITWGQYLNHSEGEKSCSACSGCFTFQPAHISMPSLYLSYSTSFLPLFCHHKNVHWKDVDVGRNLGALFVSTAGHFNWTVVSNYVKLKWHELSIVAACSYYEIHEIKEIKTLKNNNTYSAILYIKMQIFKKFHQSCLLEILLLWIYRKVGITIFKSV